MDTNAFGRVVWGNLQLAPLGSLTKRELELNLLEAAIQSGLLKPRPEVVAALCRVSLARAHGYLTDLALRQEPLTDRDAIEQLVQLLARVEVIKDETHFSVPLHDAAVRIWLERKMATLALNSGDTLRRDHVKLTPAGLAKLIASSDGLLTPFEALKTLPKGLQKAEWVVAANKSWKKGMTWVDAIGVLGNTATVAQAILPAVLSSLGA